jgi:hypothetical protein
MIVCLYFLGKGKEGIHRSIPSAKLYISLLLVIVEVVKGASSGR